MAHVGISTRGIIESSKNIEPSWSALIADLQGYGAPAAENKDFVEGFLAGAKSMTEQPAPVQRQREFRVMAMHRILLIISVTETYPAPPPEKKHKIPRKQVTIL